MTTYEIIARRDVRRALYFAPELTKDVLEQRLTGAAVETLSGDQWNEIGFRVRLNRPTHDQALAEIAALVWEFAFYVAEATVSEMAGAAVEAGFIETFGGGGLVLSLAGIAGKLTEVVVGEEANKIRRDYEAHLDHEGHWTLTRLPATIAADSALMAGYSSA
jgi:hypothetical protein